MKAEVDHVEIGGRGEADNRRGREVVRRGIEFGVNHIAGDVEGGALALRGGGDGDGGEHDCQQTIGCLDGEPADAAVKSAGRPRDVDLAWSVDVDVLSRAHKSCHRSSGWIRIVGNPSGR